MSTGQVMDGPTATEADVDLDRAGSPRPEAAAAGLLGLSPVPAASRGDAGASLERAGAMDPWDRPRAMATPFDDGIAFSSPFSPIAEYAFLPRCCAAALLAPDGTLEWLCPPRFDASSVFAAILGRGAGGFRFGPVGIGVPAGRRYEPGTNVLGTTWQTASGWAVPRESLIIGGGSGGRAA
ncbi:MAG: trehalase-like domain-containing protein [Solirubrobacteraceae bacterium]